MPDVKGPAGRRHTLRDLDKVLHMQHAGLLVRAYDACLKALPDQKAQQHRAAGADPECGQTACGLALEMHLDAPHYLWTPWGRWRIASDLVVGLDLSRFMSRVRLRQVSPPFGSNVQGVLYGVLAIDDAQLPELVLRDLQEYCSPAPLRMDWERFAALATIEVPAG